MPDQAATRESPSDGRLLSTRRFRRARERSSPAESADVSPSESSSQIGRALRAARSPGRIGQVLLNTKSVGAGIVSLGAGLAGAAALPAAAGASCWTSTCRAFVPNKNVNKSVRQWAPWGVVNSNRAHYYDCVQVRGLSLGNYYYSPNPAICGYSAVMGHPRAGYSSSQATDWKYDANGCANMWAKEYGHFPTTRGWTLYTC